MKTKLFLFFIIGILIAVNVKGFAVSSPYWSDNPLIMEPGETKIVTLILQNMVGSEDLIAHASLLQGSEVARIIDSSLDYNVPFGKDDIKVNIEVTIPNNAPLESKYTIDVNFVAESKNKKEGVQLNTGVRKLIDVYVREVPEPTAKATEESKESAKKTNYLWAIILLVILILILIWAFRKKGEGK